MIDRAPVRAWLIMLGKPSLFCGNLLLLSRTRERLVIVINAGTGLVVWVDTLAFTTSSRSKRIQLRRERSLRLDEGTSVVAHWLVASIRVPGEDRESGSDKNHKKQDEGKNSIVDEEDDAHDSGYDTL